MVAYKRGYDRRVPVTIHSSVPTGSLSNYPKLLGLNATSGFFPLDVDTAGKGVVLASSDGSTLLPHAFIGFQRIADGPLSIGGNAATDTLSAGIALAIQNGNRFSLSGTPAAPLVANRIYYTTNVVTGTGTWQAADYPGGPPIDLTTNGSGMQVTFHYPGSALLRVNIPTIDNISDKTLYVYSKDKSSVDNNDKAGAVGTSTKLYTSLEDDPAGSAPQVEDWSASGADGTCHNMVSGDRSSFRVGNGYTYDGVSKYTGGFGAASPADNASFSIGVTVQESQPVTGAGITEPILDFGSFGSDVLGMGFRWVTSNAARFSVNNGYRESNSTTARTTGSILRLFGTYDGSSQTLKMYVGGVLQTGASAAPTGYTQVADGRIANAVNGSGVFSTVTADEIVIYDSALSAAWAAYDAVEQDSTVGASTYTMHAEEVSSDVNIDETATSGYVTSSLDTIPFTCYGGNRFLRVSVALLSNTGVTVTGITYNGIALSQIQFQAAASGPVRIEEWGLLAPDRTAAANVVVTLSGSAAHITNVVSYTGVDQLAPFTGAASATALNVGAADATVSVTTNIGNSWIVSGVATDDTSITSNQTEELNQTGANGSGAADDYLQAAIAMQAVSWTGVGAAKTWAIVAYALRPAAGSTGATVTGTSKNYTLAAAMTFSGGTHTATAALTDKHYALAAAATFASGTHTATAALTVHNTALAAAMTFAPGTHTASEAAQIGGASFSAATTFSGGTHTITDTGGIAVHNIVSNPDMLFGAGLHVATSADLNVHGCQILAIAEFSTVGVFIFINAATVSVGHVQGTADATFAPGTHTITATAMAVHHIHAAAIVVTAGCVYDHSAYKIVQEIPIQHGVRLVRRVRRVFHCRAGHFETVRIVHIKRYRVHLP